MQEEVELDYGACRFDKHELQNTCPNRVQKFRSKLKGREPQTAGPRMRHARLIFEIATQTQVAPTVVDEQDDKIIDDVGFVGVADEVQDEDGAFIFGDESKPRGEGVNRHHGKNSDNVELVLGMGIMAQVERYVISGDEDCSRGEEATERDNDCKGYH